LLDPYDVYQHLMDYWVESMQDDTYLLSAEGWKLAATPRLLPDEKKNKDKPDLVVGKKRLKAELIPPDLVIAWFFASGQAKLDELETEAASLAASIEVMVEENCGEDGPLEEAKNDKDKVTKASATARLRALEDDPECEEERKVLETLLALVERASAATATAKAAAEVLAEKVASKYADLTEDEVKVLVVDDKWLTAIGAAVQRELDRVSQALSDRVRELAERYATPLPALEDETARRAAQVTAQLRKMGAACA
jgi:type I restriction enzyme M protein